MWSTRDLPIRRKLTFVILATSTVALLVSSAALLTFQLYTFRQNFTRDLAALAEIVATNSTAAITFDDKDAAKEVLSALNAKKYLLGALITTPNGKPFARFANPDDAGRSREYPKTTGYRFDGNQLLQTQIIRFKGEQIGMLYLRSDYGAVYADLLKLYAGTLALVLAISFSLVVIISSRLQRVISAPIQKLAETAKIVAEKNDYSVRAEKLGHDEVGSFTDAFNRMLEQIQMQDAELQSAHSTLELRVHELQHEIAERAIAEQKIAVLNSQLIETSRHAGMAEVATGVLHNVGNVLNSVNVSTTLVSDQLRRSKAPNVARAAQLLCERNGDLARWLTEDPKGKMLPSYLAELGQHLNAEQAQISSELVLLSRNVEHIKEIVAMQQSYAKVSGVIEALPIEDLVEDALRINAAAFLRHKVELVRAFSPAPPVTVDKHKVLQVLINLIRNAKYAMDDCEQRILTVGISGESESVKITISDTGVGILAENLTKIFSHGFTTRKEGHGFGLHSAALAAKEMGGSITARSDGAGHGAVFTLELPVTKAALV